MCLSQVFFLEWGLFQKDFKHFWPLYWYTGYNKALLIIGFNGSMRLLYLLHLVDLGYSSTQGIPVSYTHLDVYKRQIQYSVYIAALCISLWLNCSEVGNNYTLHIMVVNKLVSTVAQRTPRCVEPKWMTTEHGGNETSPMATELFIAWSRLNCHTAQRISCCTPDLHVVSARRHISWLFVRDRITEFNDYSVTSDNSQLFLYSTGLLNYYIYKEYIRN